MVKRGLQAAGKRVDGNIARRTGAVATVAPGAARNAIKAADTYHTGMYRDATGKKVLVVDGYDIVSKPIGFQPNGVAQVQDATRACKT